MIKDGNTSILKLKIGNTQKTNIVEKGISTLRIEPQIITGIKKYFSNVKFDLVLFSTPPITFCKAIEYVKKRDNAKTYLLLKDIFPQNAVDIGLMSKNGIKGLIYKFFRKKEKRLYSISDRIGCMSQANVDYVLKHNPEINSDIVEVCPNSIEVVDRSVDEKTRAAIRTKYGIPLDKKVFVYGGNLGKPQGIDFMIKCLKSQEKNKKGFFLIVGDGTEFSKIDNYVKSEKPANVKLMQRLPKEDYDKMVGACDVGMIFLDHRFTIPNFPSRLLSYMQAQIPVFAVTDSNTDIGYTIVNGKFGWWCIFYAEMDGKIIASSIMIGANGKMNYHLSGSVREYSNLAPSNLLLYQAALWGATNGYKTLYLGGGVGSSDDNLYKFKKSFNRQDNDKKFCIGKKIFIKDCYDRLVKLHGNTESSFFPKYRA